MFRILCTILALLFVSPALSAVRVKDVTNLQGIRENQLIGYGIVVGLQATGDTLQNSTFTEQSLQSMLDHLGVNARTGQLRTRNVAAVLVTADLPPFTGRGSRVDVTVSSLGDANSLMGGTLVLTSLAGPDGQIYAVAQGQVIVSGFSAQGQAQTVTQGVPTTGRIPGGAIIEREVASNLTQETGLTLELRNPDFRTAVQIVDAINDYAKSRFGHAVARERDQKSVLIERPKQIALARFMAEIGELVVDPDTPARVVVDARSGTVVIGQDVQISTVAVTHGNLTVRITETPTVSQPSPRSGGSTVVTPQTAIDAEQQGGQIAILGGSNLRTLVRGLNQIGLKPDGIISILQAIKTAGALQADLVVQ